MTQQEARRKMDAITHGPNGLRDNFKPNEREELDRLRPIAFPDETAPTRGVRIDGKDFRPAASRPDQDFLPAEVARVVGETNPTLKMNAARALRARVMSPAQMKDHPYWNREAGDHQAWQHAMAVIAGIALGED